MTCKLTIAMNDETFAVTQYSNYPFNSIAYGENGIFGSSEDGIFKLEEGKLDNGEEIESFFEFWIGDLGVINVKRIRAIHFGGQFGGDVVATLTDDDGVSESFNVTIEKISGQRAGARVFIPRTQIGRYWKLKVASDSDFAVDRIDVTWNIMSGTKQNGR